MAILEKIAGWRHFHAETETAILKQITNTISGIFYGRKGRILAS